MANVTKSFNVYAPEQGTDYARFTSWTAQQGNPQLSGERYPGVTFVSNEMLALYCQEMDEWPRRNELLSSDFVYMEDLGMFLFGTQTPHEYPFLGFNLLSEPIGDLLRSDRVALFPIEISPLEKLAIGIGIAPLHYVQQSHVQGIIQKQSPTEKT